MKAELYFTSAGLSADDLRGKTVVVIDVLRACTVICAAFTAGCREIIPVASLGDAATVKEKLEKNTVLLAGERAARKVEGFDLGNSPHEFTPQIVRDKKIVLASTNGTKALVVGSEGDKCIAAALVNISRVVDEVSSIGSDVAIVCSGKESFFSLEDAICGGMIISRLAEKAEAANDAAAVSTMLYGRHSGDLMAALKNSDHGRYLASIGFAADIEFASRVDALPILPVWDNGRLIAGNPF